MIQRLDEGRICARARLPTSRLLFSSRNIEMAPQHVSRTDPQLPARTHIQYNDKICALLSPVQKTTNKRGVKYCVLLPAQLKPRFLPAALAGLREARRGMFDGGVNVDSPILLSYSHPTSVVVFPLCTHTLALQTCAELKHSYSQNQFLDEQDSPLPLCPS